MIAGFQISSFEYNKQLIAIVIVKEHKKSGKLYVLTEPVSIKQK